MGLFFKFLAQEKPPETPGAGEPGEFRTLPGTLPWQVQPENPPSAPSPSPAPAAATGERGIAPPRLMTLAQEGEIKPMLSRLKDIGLDRTVLKNNLVRAADALALDIDDADGHVDFEDAFRRANASLSASGFDVADQMARDMGLDEVTPPQEEPAAGQPMIPSAPPAQAGVQEGPWLDIRARRERMRQLYSQLAQHPAMNSWWGVLVFVLTSIATRSPSFAASLFLRNPNRQAILDELAALRDEIRLDLHEVDLQTRQEEARRREAQQSRMIAANLAARKEIEAVRHQNQVARMHLAFTLRAQQAASRATSDEVKEAIHKLRDEFTSVSILASKERGRMNQYRTIFGPPMPEDPNYEPYQKSQKKYEELINTMYKLYEDINRLAGNVSAPER